MGSEAPPVPYAKRILFFIALIVSASGWISPPVALTAGLIFGLTFTHPYSTRSRDFSRFLLQACVVALGFGMNLHEVVKAGRSGFTYTAAGIAFALMAGLTIGKMLAVRGTASFLITAGTAICGGSAIAAMGPILQANEEEMAVSLGTVFVLNSIALLIFPAIGWKLGLTQPQFGLWAALAIHDTSSVVGATARYGTSALIVGTVVKLARALWIVPLALATAAIKRSNSQMQIPWFVLFFCLAAVGNTYIPAVSNHGKFLFAAGRLGLTATLFLIGSGISRATLKEVGWRPLLQGLILWIAVAISSLYFIRSDFISF